jgi:hypothetical protein
MWGTIILLHPFHLANHHHHCHHCHHCHPLSSSLSVCSSFYTSLLSSRPSLIFLVAAHSFRQEYLSTSRLLYDRPYFFLFIHFLCPVLASDSPTLQTEFIFSCSSSLVPSPPHPLISHPVLGSVSILTLLSFAAPHFPLPFIVFVCLNDPFLH